MQHRPASLSAGYAIGRALSRARHALRVFARALRDARDVSRKAWGAEVLYIELSRLCDAELKRRGMDRRQIPRLVFDRLTVDEGRASLVAPRGCAGKRPRKYGDVTIKGATCVFATRPIPFRETVP